MNGCNHYRTNNSCMRNANNRQPMNNRPRMEMQTDKNMECKRRQQPDKKSLLNEINECSFAVNDMLLYLDTHPCDEAALSYFMEHKNRRVAALKEYAKYYSIVRKNQIFY